jgi:hypothetical protein
MLMELLFCARVRIAWFESVTNNRPSGIMLEGCRSTARVAQPAAIRCRLGDGPAIVATFVEDEDKVNGLAAENVPR